MKKLILYTAVCIGFLAVVILLNGLYFSLNKSAISANTIAENIEYNNEVNEKCSHLPLVIINTNGEKITKDTEIIAEISFIDKTLNYPNDTPNITYYAAIKYRGNSSYLTFDKRQYRIEFKKDKYSDKNKNVSILGMDKASDWVLNGPFLDRSLSRNYLGFKLSREILSWAPDTRYCEVYLNGDYQGLYIMIEPITNEESRLDLNEYSLLSGQTAYIIKTDRVGTEDKPINYNGSPINKMVNELSISYPSSQNITKAQYNYIVNDLSKIERVLYSDYFADEELGYAKYIDVVAFVDYFIINEFLMMNDAGSLSTYIYKDIDSKLSITVWDFNNCLDNIPWDEKHYDKFYLVTSNWFIRLIQDRRFVDMVVARYNILREGTLSDENIIKIIDDNVLYLGDAVDRNFEVWGYTFYDTLLSPGADGTTRDPRSFDEAITMLEDSVVKRGSFLDENIEMLYKYCIN